MKETLLLLKRIMEQFRRDPGCMPTLTGFEEFTGRDVTVVVGEEAEAVLDDIEQRLLDEGLIRERAWIE